MKRLIDERHLDRIRQLPCLVCGKEPAEAAHVRYASSQHNKPVTGLGRKPDDKWAVPLCPDCHRNGQGSQHTRGERAFWEEKGIDPLGIAEHLYSAGNTYADVDALEIMEKIVRSAQNNA